MTCARQDAALLFRVSSQSLIALVLGMGFRFAFVYDAYRPAIAGFSARQDITGATTWTAERPSDKAEVYRQLGLALTHDPQARKVQVNSDEKSCT
jgi:hypothetical protein